MSEDDELGRLLRGEIPDPAPGYWERIDARLEQVESETESGADTSQPVLGAEAGIAEEIRELPQTDDNVIRLTDMTQATLPRRDNYLVPILAAAAVVMVALGGFAAFRDSSVFQSTDIVGPADQTSTDQTSTDQAPIDQAPTDQVADPEPAPGSDGTADPSADAPAAVGRVCYSGTIPPRPDFDEALTAYAWVERDGTNARYGLILESGGTRDIEVGEGVIDAEGVFTGTARSLLGSTNVVDTLVLTDEAISDTVEPIEIPAVSCDDVAEPMQALDDAALQIASQAADEDAPDVIAADDEPARVWTAIADPLNIHNAPGETNPVATTAPGGSLLGGAGGAVVTEPDGFRWLAVYHRNAEGVVQLGWVRDDLVSQTEWPDRLCFSSAEPASVLVLDPQSSADTPLGALVLLTSENPIENDIPVSLVASAPPSNPGEGGDELSVFVQVGDQWEPQSWAQTSFGVASPDLAWEPVPCDEVGQAMALIEALHNDIPLPEAGE